MQYPLIRDAKTRLNRAHKCRVMHQTNSTRKCTMIHNKSDIAPKSQDSGGKYTITNILLIHLRVFRSVNKFRRFRVSNAKKQAIERFWTDLDCARFSRPKSCTKVHGTARLCTSRMHDPCVCVQYISRKSTPTTDRETKPQDGGLCELAHTLRDSLNLSSSSSVLVQSASSSVVERTSSASRSASRFGGEK